MARLSLEKRLRYRDLTGRPMEEHALHWLGFEWEAGPVIVTHKGAEWGIVQVWAASAAEGKRVIAHAAAIAGVDLGPPGQWIISTTTNPRFGRSGTMQVKRLRDNCLAVTKREGSSGTPEVLAPDP